VSKTLNVFEAATSRARVMKQGDLVQIVIDGGGAMVTTLAEFMQAQKWAQRKPATGNMVTDRGRFLEQITALVSRPGSMVSTRGNSKQVEALARSMKQAGYDIGEWMLPPELKNLGMPTAEPRKAKLADADEGENDNAGTEPGVSDPQASITPR
jgi:hypothetical protein